MEGYQGVYRFDSDVFQSVIETPITGDLPHEVFFNLPEWCVYIETPGLTYFDKELYGFFAHLEYDTNNSRKELRIVLDTNRYDDPDKLFINSQPIPLGPWSLAKSIEKAMEEFLRQSGKKDNDADPPFFNQKEYTEKISEELRALVALLLYLCSANGEFGDGEKRPTKPKPTKTKKGLRLFPPNAPKTWDVGVRMGAAIRRARQAQTQSQKSEGSVRASPKTHIRRAHWQGFWTGPRDVPGERRYTLKWILPIIVNPSEGEEIPVTIRPVK